MIRGIQEILVMVVGGGGEGPIFSFGSTLTILKVYFNKILIVII